MSSQMNKPFSMSFSKLNTFEQCPRKFYHVYIDKTLQQEESEQMLFGLRVHKALENYGRTGDEVHLTNESRRHKRVLDKITERKGDKYFEHEMAIRVDKSPCSWDDESLWFRGIADVLIVNRDVAYCLDYKTGKIKNDPTQLTLLALLTFAHFPEVEEVISGFLWLAYDDLSHTNYQRRHAEALWAALTHRIEQAQKAVGTGVYPCNPSKLCGWCPAQDFCEEAYEERSRRKR
jgi:RecB family exonuclease